MTPVRAVLFALVVGGEVAIGSPVTAIQIPRGPVVEWRFPATSDRGWQAPPAPVRPGQDRSAFVEVIGPDRPVFVHQRFRVRVCVGVERGFRSTNLLQLFQRELAFPVQLDAAWLANLPGTVAASVPSPEPPGTVPRLSFVLNGEVVQGIRAPDEVRDGRTFTVMQWERSFFAERPGSVEVPAATLRFAFATRFQDDFVNGRAPIDRQDARLTSKPVRIAVQALPDAGRPPGFRGAVGSFSLSATSSAHELEVGQSLKLELRIEGDGNLGLFPAPELAADERVHCSGKIETRTATVRTVTYDLAPLSDRLTAIPSITLVYFDPGEARYRTVRSAPIPLVVRPAADGAGGTPTPRGGLPADRDIRGLKHLVEPAVSSVPGDGSRGLLFVLLGLPWLLAFGLRTWFGARRRRVNDRERQRRSRAASEFRARMELADPAAVDPQPAQAFAEYLAAQLGCSATAVISHDLHARLLGAGVPRELVEETDRVMHDLVASRYGGAAASAGPDQLLALVADLEKAFAATRRG